MEASANYPHVGMYVMGRCLIVSIQVELYDDVISEIQQGILLKVRESQIRGVLLDVSMVEVMDAHIAQSLTETVQMIDMLGARSVMVGIRPAVASALMDLDVPPLDMRTAVTLEHGKMLLEPFIQENGPGEKSMDEHASGDVSSDDASTLADENAQMGTSDLKDEEASLSDDVLRKASTADIYPDDNSEH